MLVMGSNSECHDERWESAETIRNNIQSMIDTLKKEWPNIFILLNTPPPIRDDPQLKTIVENGRETNILWREQKRIAEISDVIREFEGPNIGICDLYKALSDRPDKRWYIDGVHLSEAAEEEVWADLAVQGLEAGL
jgi:lysophospholipase L1-like esterase